MNVYILTYKITEGNSNSPKKEIRGVFASKELAHEHMEKCVKVLRYMFTVDSFVVCDLFAMAEYKNCEKKQNVVFEIEGHILYN